MRKTLTYPIKNKHFLRKALQWASAFDVVCLLHSSGFKEDRFSESIVGSLLAVGVIKEIHFTENHFASWQQMHSQEQDWNFGFLSYDLKEELEGLLSENPDHIGFPLMHFFVPQYLFELNGENLSIHYLPEYNTVESVEKMVQQIDSQEREAMDAVDIRFNARVPKQKYIETVSQIKQHIQKGDIYEMCYCMEFCAEQVSINPALLYLTLNEVSPTPFSCFYKWHDKYLLSASPERFLKKEKNKVFSQPIKGTAPRDINGTQDKLNKELLYTSAKEQSENVMIVDLVRNDLSVNAIPGTVKVEELYGIYSFPQVHQMISTVSCEVDENVKFTDIIKAAFPMGSMTGAPKIKAMKLAEKYENVKRGLYSGAVGYVKPNTDFDLNVVIRSLQYNKEKQYLSFIVGSAITANSDPEKEYEECLIKAQAMLKAVEVYAKR